MKAPFGVGLVVVSCLVCLRGIAAYDNEAADQQKMVWTFKDDADGAIARGFKTEVGDWKVVTADGEKVLAQEAKNSNSTFNLVLVADTRARDVDLSVKMKAIAGETDQGGGLVWRAKDKNNYYLARYNPLEDNFRLYKVQDGKRSQFDTADIKASPGWHTLRVTMQGESIECFYDGKKSLEHKDSTFTEAGMIGLWSKADAQSHFDDLTFMATKSTKDTKTDEKMTEKSQTEKGQPAATRYLSVVLIFLSSFVALMNLHQPGRQRLATALEWKPESAVTFSVTA